MGWSTLLVLVLTLPAASTAGAQATDSTQLKRFQRANSYMRSGQFEQAIDLLEELYAEAPQNISFYRKLKDAYESVKKYDEAMRLVDNRIGDSPTPALLSEKARLLHQKGNRKRASKVWDRALDLQPQRAQTYRTVYQTLVTVREFRQAIDVLNRGREALDRPDAFRTQLARLYGLDGQHERAMQEYVTLLADSPQRASFVRGRLETFVDQGEGIEANIRVLQNAVGESPLNRAYRELLAWLHMEQSDYEAAFDVYRALDRLEEQNGRGLLQFARQAQDAQEYEVAATAFESILDRYPDGEVAPQAQLLLGDTYRRWALAGTDSSAAQTDSTRFDRAVQAYETFLQSYPSHRRYPQVLLRLGILQLDQYHELGEAESTLNQLVSNHPQTTAAEEGQYHLGRIAILRDSLGRARLLFSRLARTAQRTELADRAEFELALLSFYRGDFESAITRSEAISENTSADVTNDAIELKVLLAENRGPDSLDTALRTFARARLYDRQRLYDAALTQLDSLTANHPRHPLRDDAQFRRAKISVAQGDTARALDAFRRLPDQHPRSPFADRSLYEIGLLLESRGKNSEAVEVYNRLLSEYPQSLRASDARTRMRTLLRAQG